MPTSFGSLGLGLILAVVLVYLLMVVLFQSWLDPFDDLAAVPGALVVSSGCSPSPGTTLNVELFMGAIMSVGIAVSNSILLVSMPYAQRWSSQPGWASHRWRLDCRREGPAPAGADDRAGDVRNAADGPCPGRGRGAANHSLGRAVIGGLLVATFVTLFIVPVVYSVLRRKEPQAHRLDQRFLEESQAHTLERWHERGSGP